MRHQHQKSYDQKTLKQFYQNRSKFNQQAKDILGVNLHDISKQSKGDNSNSEQKKNNIFNNSNVFDQFFSQIDQSSRGQRLHKQNIDLKNKNIKLIEQNKCWKYKAGMWDKAKQFIKNQFHPKLQLIAVNIQSSDTILLEQFLNAVNTIIQTNLNAQNLSMQNKNQALQQDQQLFQKIAKLQIDNQKLSIENQLMRAKIQSMKNERKARFSEIEMNIQQRFDDLKNNNELKKQENTSLQQRIKLLEAQIVELKRKKVTETRKSEPEFKQYNKEAFQLQFLKKMGKMREEQNIGLKSEIFNLQSQRQELRIINGKLKRVIGYACSINTELMVKIQTVVDVSKNKHLGAVNNEYFNRDTTARPPQTFLKNSRFKIVKSRSEEKNSLFANKYYNNK